LSLLAPTKAPYPLISKKTVTPIRTDQKARPPHPEPENRAIQERNDPPDEVKGSGMAISYFPALVFSVGSASARKNRRDTCCASRSNATLEAKNIGVKLGSRWFDFLLMIVSIHSGSAE
jgi:hypothetical protein